MFGLSTCESLCMCVRCRAHSPLNHIFIFLMCRSGRHIINKHPIHIQQQQLLKRKKNLCAALIFIFSFFFFFRFYFRICDYGASLIYDVGCAVFFSTSTFFPSSFALVVWNLWRVASTAAVLCIFRFASFFLSPFRFDAVNCARCCVHVMYWKGVVYARWYHRRLLFTCSHSI